jgi:hypothetical protein
MAHIKSIVHTEFIDKHPDKPWDWYFISSNPNITMKDIEKSPDKPWSWDYISNNPNITTKFIKKIIKKI